MAKPFEFSEIQANHILDLALGRLTQLGRDELLAEQQELEARIKELRRILEKRDALMAVIREELTVIRDTYKQPRRTQIVGDDTGEISTEELVDDEPLVVSLTARGYVQARSARGRGGAGRGGAGRGGKVVDAGPNDVLSQVVETSALGAVLVFTSHGRAYRAACHDLPKQRLTALPNLFQFGDGEHVVAAIDTAVGEEHEHVVFVTEQGTIKRTPFAEFTEASGRRDGIVAMKLADGDRVVSVYPGWDEFEALVVTRNGQAIRFAESEVRPVGRSAGGIRAIRLRSGDAVVGAAPVAPEELVALASDAGYAKRVRVDELPVQARGGSGVRALKPERKRGTLVGVAPVLTTRVGFLLDDGAVVVAATDVKLVAREAALPKVAEIAADRTVTAVVSAADPPAAD